MIDSYHSNVLIGLLSNLITVKLKKEPILRIKQFKRKWQFPKFKVEISKKPAVV